MHTISTRTNMPKGVVVYSNKGADVASFPAFLNGNRMPTLSDVIKLCGSVSTPVKVSPVVVAFKADDKAMTFTWYAGREMWSAQVETTTGGSTHWWMTPAEMHAWVNGRGYSAQFAQAHAEAVEALQPAPVGVVPAVIAQTYEVCAPVPAFPEAPSAPTLRAKRTLDWAQECIYIADVTAKRGNVKEMNRDRATFVRYCEMQRDTAERQGFADSATYIQECIDDLTA